jgi:hypothetical protein
VRAHLLVRETLVHTRSKYSLPHRRPVPA